MSMEMIIEHLEHQKACFETALDALNGTGKRQHGRGTRSKRRTMSASARKRISDAQKRSWAARKKAKS